MADERVPEGDTVGGDKLGLGNVSASQGLAAGAGATSQIINLPAADTLVQSIFLTLLDIRQSQGRLESVLTRHGERLDDVQQQLGFHGERLRGIEGDVQALKQTSQARKEQADGLDGRLKELELHVTRDVSELKARVADLARKEPGTVQLTRGQWIFFSIFVFVVAVGTFFAMYTFLV